MGKDKLPDVTKGSVSAILLASVMRILLFAVALGVIFDGGLLDPLNPAASVFRIAAGSTGYKIFGIVLWCAAITSVVGAAYTSVSFLRSFHPSFETNQRWIITIFILFSTILFSLVGKPVKVLVLAGALNGLVLPFSLGIILLATVKKNYLKEYRHPLWMSWAGWIVVVLLLWWGFNSLFKDIPKLWQS